MKKQRLCVALLCAFAISGCAAAGVQVTEEQAKSFQVGRSTYGDVVAALGPPTTTSTMSDGKRIAIYSYAAVQSRPQNFIPYIGPLVAGYDSQSSAVTFMFDGRGILTNSSSTQTGMGGGSNLAAGGTPVQQTQQPRQAQ